MSGRASNSDPGIEVRRCLASDHDAVLALADRLMIGIAPWRDRDACLQAVRGWVRTSLARSAEQGALLVASDAAGRVIGFVSVEASAHFSGEREAYIGELVVDERFEGRGVGRTLVAAVESWARQRDFRTLTLVTGAANAQARGFYDRLGFREEEVRLTRVL